MRGKFRSSCRKNAAMKLREMLMVLAALASLFSEGDSGSECTVQKDDPCKCSTNNTAIDLTQVFSLIP